MPINVTRSALPPKEEYFEEIASLWDSRWLTNMGEKHQTLERMLQEYLGAPNVTLYTNGHLALGGGASVLATFLKVGPQRASGVRVVSLRPCCCFEPRIASVELE